MPHIGAVKLTRQKRETLPRGHKGQCPVIMVRRYTIRRFSPRGASAFVTQYSGNISGSFAKFADAHGLLLRRAMVRWNASMYGTSKITWLANFTATQSFSD